MSDPIDRAHHLERKIASLQREGVDLRHWMAEVAGSVADSEEQLADLLERIAERRSPADAARLQAMADDARRYAAKEHDRSARYRA
jgi:phage shock protein A